MLETIWESRWLPDLFQKQVLKRETAERFMIMLVFTSDQKVKQKRFLLSDD